MHMRSPYAVLDKHSEHLALQKRPFKYNLM